MKPLFFGDPKRPLFGVFDPAKGPKRRGEGVLCVYPDLTEYNTAHRAFRRLATMLSQAGFDVFRFDYYGTGDSSGETGAGDAQDALSDLATAANELTDLARTSRVSLVGMQLGALWGAMASAKHLALETLVLWEPVTSGAEHLRKLEMRHEAECLWRMVPPPSTDRPSDELVGHPISKALRRDLAPLRLDAFKPQAKRIGIVHTPTSDDDGYYARWAKSQGLEVSVHATAATQEARAREAIVLADGALTHIADFLARPTA